MTAVRWATQNEQARVVYRAVSTFLNGRLCELGTVNWALGLRSDDAMQRLALLDLVERSDPKSLGEPWRSAWSLVQEHWETTPPIDTAVAAYRLRRRLQSGDRTGTAISDIIDMVKPRLRVAPFSKSDLQFRKPPARPRLVSDIVSAGLTSGELVDPAVLDLSTISEAPFLYSLANGLEAAVVTGLDIARRLGWNEERHLWGLGGLNRAYYVAASSRAPGTHEPDEFHRGIAPSVKLLHSVVTRLAEIDTSEARGFVRRWKLVDSPIHMRLWAALSQDVRLSAADEVGLWLLSLSDRMFWSVNEFPEIAELRALRFAEFTDDQQIAIISRIRKRPPPNLWPRQTDPARIRSGRQLWAGRELRRLEVGGATLSRTDKVWLSAKTEEFPQLEQMSRVDEGFFESPKAVYVQPQPDSRFDLISGEERLKALQNALSATRTSWDEDPPRGAADWIRGQGNASNLIADFEAVADGGARASRVWEQFGWTHSPPTNQQGAEANAESLAEASRVLTLLAKLPPTTIRPAIEGLSHWLQTWEWAIVGLSETFAVWSKLWPIAVEATNAMQQPEEPIDLNTVARPSDDREPMDLDTLNSAAGRLVSVFLAACPTIQASDRPFDDEGPLRSMRDIVMSATGRSGLIARHRLIDSLPYFMTADSGWAQEFLIKPVLSDSEESLALWRAIGRQPHFYKVLTIIGGPMTERATDRRLGRETRQMLVFSLVVECLHALKDARDPAVPYSRMQQMLRSLEDEVRAHAADTIRRFIEGVSSSSDSANPAPTAEVLFRASAAPFLEQVWPQERSLNTPGASRSFAHLPAVTGDAFAEAVKVVERFLVPFECWSLIEYGLYGDEDGKPKLSLINDGQKAAALLRLLDLTIGASEGSVIPHDLSEALQQIQDIAPKLQEDPVFRRLATAARR